MSLVSKALGATTEPLLYSEIEWTWLEDRLHPIAAFLRTILRRPEPAANVRSVVLLRDDLCFDQYHDDSLPKIPIDRLGLNNALEAHI